MAKAQKSVKQMQIDKTNSAIVLTVSLAAIVIAFSGVSIKSMLVERAYQSKVITQQRAALKVAKADVTAIASLSAAYKSLDEASTNIIGGYTTGTGPQDGPSSKIILDGLPSKYDFPAIISSLTNLLQRGGFKTDALAASNTASLQDAATTSPTATEIPFQYGTTGSYGDVKNLVSTLDRSVRPVAISTMQISGSDAQLSINVSAKTFFQPGKTLNVTTQVVK